MKHGFIECALVATLAALVSCGPSPSEPALRARSKAEEAFRSSLRGSRKDVTWDLTGVRVFGRDSLFGRMVAGRTQVAGRPDSAGTYAVSIPFWCRGVNAQADPVRRKGQFRANVRVTGTVAELLNASLGPFESLSFWRQLFAYLGWGLLFGLILGSLGRFFGLFAGHTPVVLTGLAGIPLAGYVASVAFGSLPAIVLCVCVNIAMFVVVETLTPDEILMQKDVAKGIRIGMLLGPFALPRAKKRERERVEFYERIHFSLDLAAPAYDARGLGWVGN